MTADDLSDDQRAFLAGFMASGEGFNGEWPFEGEPAEVVWPEIERDYNRWVGHARTDAQ